MKRLFLAIGFFAAFASNQCFGQTAVSKANIPFAFEVGKVSFPAGEYTVYQKESLIRIETGRGAHSAFMLSLPLSDVGRPDRNYLRFRVYGGRYFLSEIWTSNSGLALPMSKNEQFIAKSFSTVEPKDKTIATNRPPK